MLANKLVFDVHIKFRSFMGSCPQEMVSDGTSESLCQTLTPEVLNEDSDFEVVDSSVSTSDFELVSALSNGEQPELAPSLNVAIEQFDQLRMT